MWPMTLTEKLKSFEKRVAARFNLYRVITLIGFLVFVILVMMIPARMSGASPWAYYYGVKNFSQGKLLLTDREYFKQMDEARREGGMLMQYVKTPGGQWALEKAPGYVFYVVPFQLLGIPRWGNILLAAAMVVVVYLLLKRIRDELAACLGSLLVLFCPIGLIMANRTYMDTFASLAFLVIGAGLYFLYLLEKEKWGRVKGPVILFIAFFLIGWSVVTRQSNLLVAVVIALHYTVIRLKDIRKDRTWFYRELPAVVLGAGIPAALLMGYNQAVFGSVWDYGYKYTMFPVKFAYEYLGQVDKFGASIPLNIITENLKALPVPLLEGFPILIVFIPAVIFVIVWKFIYKRKGSAGLWGGLEKEIPWGTLWVLLGWFVCVFGLYFMYEFTAEYLKEGSSFFRYARYDLPGLFPMAFIAALVVTRLPRKVIIPIMALVFITGLVFYLQAALNVNA